MDEFEKTMVGGGDKPQPSLELPPTLRITLSFTKGASQGQRVRLMKSVNTVGRKAPADIVVADPTVSGSHARIEVVNGIVTLFDCDSTNGTFVSGQKVTKAVVNNMDEIGFGDVRALLTVVDDPYGLYSDDSEPSYASPDQTAVSVSEPVFEHCLVAGYSPALKAILEKFINDKKLAKELMTVNHGGEFIEAACIGFRDGKPVDIIITEMRMPLMGGIQVSIAFRHMEKAFGVKEPAPIVFFSELPKDANAERAVEYLKPCRYLQAVADQAEFTRRSEALVDRLAQLGRQRKG